MNRLKYTTPMIVIILSIGIAAFFLIDLASDSDHPRVPLVESGSLDLEDWSLQQDGPISLFGEWEFYSSQLIDPLSFSNEEVKDGTLLPVPKQWSSIDGLEAKGYGTYRLLINGIQPSKEYLLRIYKIPSAFRVYINGQLVGSQGKIGDSLDSESPAYGPAYTLFSVTDNKLDIVIHTSNFHYKSGGIRGAIEIGLADQMMAKRDSRLTFQMIMVGGLLLLGIYHFVIFLYRRNEKPALFFAITCLLICLRTLLVGETYFTKIFPNIPWLLQIKLMYLSLYLLVPSFVLFFYYLTEKRLSRKIITVITILTVIFSILVIVTPPDVFTQSMNYYNYLVVLIIIYLTIHVIREILSRRPGFLLMGVCGIFLGYTAVYDMIHYNKETQQGELVSLGIFVLVIGISIVNSVRLAKSFTYIEGVHYQLKEWNKALEERVQERTSELEQANQRLQELSFIDGLTNVRNRRYFNEVFEQEWNKGISTQDTISIMLIDVDFFKDYNDYYGHLDGDDVLKKLASAFKHMFNEVEKATVARYGGEEFVILLPGLSYHEALHYGEKLLTTINQLQIEHKNSKVSSHITVSIGVATARPVRDEKQESLLLAADQALYEAKHNGRNRVESKKVLPDGDKI
ncbi:sensor domain-containing diguanylate cyclase [Bacillus pinisoli]|uniref:sensor domain-containing diguanylate cyclase n=1 Tax=Bacillus pinisoli TaxID=2901866 RepID=UPI001FF60127|nr:diguanylate cyclase [Bacillus pinisoli]